MALGDTGTYFSTATNGIQYYERVVGYSETWTDGQAGIVRQLFCPWADRDVFVSDMIGDARRVGDLLRRDLPEEDKHFSGMYCVDMQFVGGLGFPSEDQSDSTLAYFSENTMTFPRTTTAGGYAVYNCTFKRPLYKVKSDDDIDNDPNGYGERGRYVFRTRGGRVQNLKAPFKFLKFASDTNPDNYISDLPGVILFPQPTFTMVWHMVPFEQMSSDVIDGMLGKVNNIAWEGFTAGTLMFVDYNRVPYQSANTGLFETITYSFMHNRQGHNFFLRNSGVWEEVVRRGDPLTGVYEEGDFDELFDVSL